MNMKKTFQEQLIYTLEPLKEYYSGGSILNFSGHSAWYEDETACMEAFARPLWGLVPFWAGGGHNEEFEQLYIDGITLGTDKDSPYYWGECHERDQRYVEMAAFAYGLIFTPDKLWEPLGVKAKENLVKWLSQINAHEVCDSNWRFFRVLVNIALKKLKKPYSEEKFTEDLTRLDEFYVSDGWYRDGVHGQSDYYIAFAFHFYSLIYAITMEEDDPKRAALYKERACEFAKTFIYWFDFDGEALPYGRSLTYRFAQTAFWSACVIAEIEPFPIEVMKGIIMRNLDNWFAKNTRIGGVLTVGYDYPNLLMAEHYNAHGSPYWGLKVFAFLMLPDNHSFWTCDAAPLPRLQEKLLIQPADMLISRRHGRTVAYPAVENEYFDCGQIIPKYLKFAYSAHFGFNVMRSQINLAEAAPDNMLAFDVDGLIMVRRHFKSAEVTKNEVKLEWSPFKGIDVKTTLIPTGMGHIREHEIISEYDCTAYDAGFAVAQDGCKSGEGGRAFAQNAFQRCEVYSETGGEGMIIPASPNTNLKYPKTVIPAVKYHIPKGRTVIKTVINDFLGGKNMTVPSDPVILLSFVNMKLRDFYSSFGEMCDDMELDRNKIELELSSIGYNYNEKRNQFV